MKKEKRRIRKIIYKSLFIFFIFFPLGKEVYLYISFRIFDNFNGGYTIVADEEPAPVLLWERRKNSIREERALSRLKEFLEIPALKAVVVDAVPEGAKRSYSRYEGPTKRIWLIKYTQEMPCPPERDVTEIGASASNTASGKHTCVRVATKGPSPTHRLFGEGQYQNIPVWYYRNEIRIWTYAIQRLSDGTLLSRYETFSDRNLSFWFRIPDQDFGFAAYGRRDRPYNRNVYTTLDVGVELAFYTFRKETEQ